MHQGRLRGPNSFNSMQFVGQNSATSLVGVNNQSNDCKMHYGKFSLTSSYKSLLGVYQLNTQK